MAAVEGNAPHLVPRDRAAIGEREVEALVAHRAEVADRGIRRAGGRRQSRIVQQAFRPAVVHVHGEVAAALQELEVQADVRRLVRLPLHVGIAEGDLPEAGLDCPGTADVVEGVPAVAAELGHDAPARNLLVPGFTPTEPQHHVGEEAVLWEERLARGAPADVERRERAPPVRRRELRRAVPPQRGARIIPLGVVVVRLPKE